MLEGDSCSLSDVDLAQQCSSKCLSVLGYLGDLQCTGGLDRGLMRGELSGITEV